MDQVSICGQTRLGERPHGQIQDEEGKRRETISISKRGQSPHILGSQASNSGAQNSQRLLPYIRGAPFTKGPGPQIPDPPVWSDGRALGPFCEHRLDRPGSHKPKREASEFRRSLEIGLSSGAPGHYVCPPLVG